MRSVSYRSYEDNCGDGFNLNSRRSTEHPLVVNCTGAITISRRLDVFNRKGRADYYLMYLSEGKIRYFFDGGAVSAGAGDFVIFPPEYRYKYSFSQGTDSSYYFVHFTGATVESLLSSLSFDRLPCVMHAGQLEDTVRRFSDLFDIYAVNDELRDISLGWAAEGILISLARAVRKNSGKSPISHSLTYINSSYTDDISVATLAAMEGLSVSRYNAVFRATVGTSPMKYMIGLRMQHACTLLLGTDLGVAEVGRMVGYEDNHFFSKIFKAYMGASPREYRRSSAGQE